jgi:integrase
VTDRRSEPHAKRFVCSNPNALVRHVYDVMPGDPEFIQLVGKKRKSLIYVCPQDDTRMFSRRTVSGDLVYPEPAALLKTIKESPGYPYAAYRNDLATVATLLTRDRALVSLLYLAMLRVSEALRLRRYQFKIEEGRVLLSNIRLSKRKFADYRLEAWLPLHGERAPFTELFLKHLATVSDPDALLFPGTRWQTDETGERTELRPLTTRHGWNVVNALTGSFNHFFRALGEDYMVRHGALLVDLGKYLKVDPSIIARYVHDTSKVPVV